MDKKISEFQDFNGKHLLLVAQKRGVVALGGKVPFRMSDTDVTLIGLGALLAEHNIGGINEIVANMEEAK